MTVREYDANDPRANKPLDPGERDSLEISDEKREERITEEGKADR